MSIRSLWKVPMLIPVVAVEFAAGVTIVMVHLALAGAYDHRRARRVLSSGQDGPGRAAAES